MLIFMRLSAEMEHAMSGESAPGGGGAYLARALLSPLRVRSPLARPRIDSLARLSQSRPARSTRSLLTPGIPFHPAHGAYRQHTLPRCLARAPLTTSNCLLATLVLSPLSPLAPTILASDSKCP